MQQASAAKLESPELKDRRFSGDAWKASPAHAFAAAWYLLNARYLQELADALETDPKTRERIRFAVQQWTAAAPSNFLALNPDAQKSILDTQGESLRQGMMNLLGDMQRGKISQTDESQFVVGKNLGCTEGAVVYENDLIQLIQYNAKADKVFERPLLIVPPCINKFYILDLQPENSLVAHALSSGHQVFLVSWRNADASIAHKTWDDYMNEGLLAAIDAVQQVSGREQINTLGFCVGGTMLATALAVLAARGEHPAASMTLLTAMLDFTDTGILDVFVDEAHVQMREQTIGGKNGTAPGLMRGVEFANTFSFLRPNDLVWNYVVDNYLKGRTPAAFDLLYWNSDSTSLPGPMYAWYLRNTYLEQAPRAERTDGLRRARRPVAHRRADLHLRLARGPSCRGDGLRIDVDPDGPAEVRARRIGPHCRRDQSAGEEEAQLLGQRRRSARSRGRLVRGRDRAAGQLVDHWVEWLDQYGGRKVAPPAQPGSAQFPVIEPAPGRYVLQRD
jgi:polyhydroxyalkanoate synthase